MNSHGVSEEKIDFIISHKEEITPRYLAYWVRTVNLIRSFEDIGMDEEQLNEVLADIGSYGRRNDTEEIINEKYSSDFTNEIQHNFYGEGLSVVKNKIGEDASGVYDSLRPSSPKSHIAVAHFPKMLHITTDYIGTTEIFLQSKDYQELNRDLLSTCALQIVALFSDERGIGALVKHFIEENDTPFAEERKVSHKESTSDDSHGRNSSGIPRYGKFTKTAKWHQEKIGLKQTQTAPHITLVTNPGKSASEIGEAAYEFQELLSSQSYSTLEKDALATSDFSHSEEEPTSHSENDPQFKIISIGKFKAVLFKRPVRFTGTYAYSYSATTAKPIRRSRARSK